MKISDISLIDSSSFEHRKYQNDIFNNSKSNNSLVVLPTGTGKTLISIAISLNSLEKNSNKKVLFLTPTKPLAKQQALAFKDFSNIDEDKISTFSGDISPEKRGDMFEDLKIICSTPQTIKNDIVHSRVDLDKICHITYDECHRAVGNYAYVSIAKDFNQSKSPSLVTGLTASPGSKIDEIKSVCVNLNISNIEVYTEDDLKDYIKETRVENMWIDLDEEIINARDKVESYYSDVLSKLKENGVLNSSSTSQSFYKIQKAKGKVTEALNKPDSKSEDYKNRSLISEAMQLNQMIEIIESQGLSEFIDFYENLDNSSTKSSKRIKSSPKICDAIKIAEDYDKKHPKISRLKAIIAKRLINDKNVLVFSKNRNTVNLILECLNEIDKIKVDKLIGQNNKEGDPGMSQSEQIETIEKFERGELDVLISTQVGEEGLDIPEVDLVVFFEPVSSEIRKIQRKGRTGRSSSGECITLIATDDSNSTRDVGYYYSSKRKEEKMFDNIEKVKENKDKLKNEINQSNLDEFNRDSKEEQGEKTEDSSVEVIADNRETKSSVVQKLSRDEGVSLEVEQLEVGDYIVSSECAIERKTVEDFLDTISGERSLLGQAKNLASKYNDPVYIIEGDQKKLYSGNIHYNSIVGFINSLSSDYDINIIPSHSEKNTYKIIKNRAEKYQNEKDSEVNMHSNKAIEASKKEKQEYIVSSIPNVGPKTSIRLLNKFGTIRDISNASKEKLQNIENIGKEKSSKIYNILNEDYND